MVLGSGRVVDLDLVWYCGEEFLDGCVRFLYSDDDEMMVEGSDCYEFDHYTDECFEYYPDFEQDAMVSDLFSLERTYFGSLGLKK